MVNERNIHDLLCPLPMATTVKCSCGTAPCRQLHQTFTRWGLPHFYRWGHELRKAKRMPKESQHGSGGANIMRIDRRTDVRTFQLKPPAVRRKPGGWV